MRALLTRKIQFEKEKSKIRYLWTQLNFIEGLIEFMKGLIARKKCFLSQFGFYLEEIKVQGSNYNLPKDLTIKFQNLSDQAENSHFTSQNSTVSKDTVHHLLHYTREAVSVGRRRNN
jgi:carboxylesterase type B